MKWNDIFGSVSHQWADWTEGNPRRVAKTSRRGPRLRSQKKKGRRKQNKKSWNDAICKASLSLSLSLWSTSTSTSKQGDAPPPPTPRPAREPFFFPSSYFILFLFFLFYFGCRVDLMESVWSAAFRVPRRPVRPFFRFLFLSFLPFFFVVRFDFWFRKSSARRQKSSFFFVERTSSLSSFVVDVVDFNLISSTDQLDESTNLVDGTGNPFEKKSVFPMMSSRNIGLTGLIARNARCCQVMRLLVISSTHQLDQSMN